MVANRSQSGGSCVGKCLQLACMKKRCNMSGIIDILNKVDFTKTCLDRTGYYDVVLCRNIDRCDWLFHLITLITLEITWFWRKIASTTLKKTKQCHLIVAMINHLDCCVNIAFVLAYWTYYDWWWVIFDHIVKRKKVVITFAYWCTVHTNQT